MKRIVKDAMEAGAIGFSTTTLEQHNGENGIPMPSRLADEREMFELTGVLGEVGKGVFMLTKGMTSTIPWLEEIAARNGRPVMVAAMLVDPNDPERVFRELGEISEAKGRGRELWGPGRLLPPRDGVLPRSSLSPRGVPRVASRHRGLESRGVPAGAGRSLVPGSGQVGGDDHRRAQPVLLPQWTTRGSWRPRSRRTVRCRAG